MVVVLASLLACGAQRAKVEKHATALFYRILLGVFDGSPLPALGARGVARRTSRPASKG